ncbi:MAG: hypothetical protein Q9171_001306 [Xanthocarpia ochracea]
MNPNSSLSALGGSGCGQSQGSSALPGDPPLLPRETGDQNGKGTDISHDRYRDVDDNQHPSQCGDKYSLCPTLHSPPTAGSDTTSYSPEYPLPGLSSFRPRSKCQPPVPTDKQPTSRLPPSVVKQEQDIEESLIARERLLKQVARASVEMVVARHRREAKPMPHPTAFGTQQPSASDYNQPSVPSANLAFGPHNPSTAELTLPLRPGAQLNLQDVEHTLASLNRQIKSANSTSDTSKKERLANEKKRVLKVLRNLNTENHQQKNGSVSNAAHLGNLTEQHAPSDLYSKASDRYARMHNNNSSIVRYVPIDRYTPQPKTGGSANLVKRPREPSPEEENEAMAEVITQVNRLTKRVAGLQHEQGPQKRRKGAAEALAVALRASVEELLAKTKDITR